MIIMFVYGSNRLILAMMFQYCIMIPVARICISILAEYEKAPDRPVMAYTRNEDIAWI